ncbi:uncharacterized protein LOC122672330 [Telopea speciosissima]|uniref:uncharacterized protein LOC122672330 n=1 Tax=Telopea speciosissima TaxID=54955 RepID=UPI001CC613B6|nr:uncharacterized protein LOC122672330 [Telopea speciosissima]
MTRQIVLPRQAQVTNQKMRFAEIVGETTADCAAVCCCMPCGLVKLLVLTMYKWPAGLCRKALKHMKKKKEQQRLKNRLLSQKQRCTCGCNETELQALPVSVDLLPLDNSDKDDQTAKEFLELDKEMWDQFYNAGFWRSPSNRD